MPMRPAILHPLFSDISQLKGVGPRVREALSRAMGVRNKDLLFTRPTGCIDRSYRPSLANAHKDDIATFKVTVGTHSVPSKRSRPYRIRVFDETGDMTLIFFQARADYLQRILPEGSVRVISGKVEVYQTQLQMSHPDYVLPLDNEAELPLFETTYPLTAGLSQKIARKAVMQTVNLIPELDEWLDNKFVSERGWPPFHKALKQIHQPEHPADPKPGSPILTRLAYDELFAKQLAMALMRDRDKRTTGHARVAKGEYVQDVLNGAPFEPTSAQKRVVEEIIDDLQSPYRMARLLQGDVGSGKTFVAALAAAYMCEAGGQVAIMAPTEILARQHLKTLKNYLSPAGLTVSALTGQDKGQKREAIKTGLAGGHIDVIIGTHALFQGGVDFHNLGLVIIDEQHRFGVQDRLRLSHKGQHPDFLVMTATPIPRTLALGTYGDLDVSRIDEKPQGRQPIDTRIVPIAKLDNVVSGLHRALDDGAQVYWVCPLVEDSEVMDLTSAETRYTHLRDIFGNRVGLVHGRLSAKEKEATSEAFKAGHFDILVATTVIEVGVDAPNATIIVIEHAERFGLAQLHQLRGRVGRSDKASSCVLLYDGPLSANGKARLEIMRESEDGFVIAEKDWELRGSGDLLGDRQSGLPAFHFAQLDIHTGLLETAHQDARYMVQTDPLLETPRGRACLNALYLFEQDYGVKRMLAG